MGVGFLKVQVHTGDDALPVKNADVVIKNNAGKVLYQLRTDISGNTESVRLAAPDKYHSLDPDDKGSCYETYEVFISKDNFATNIVHGVEVYDTVESILPVALMPLEQDDKSTTYEYDIPEPALLKNEPRNQEGIINPFVLREVIIPDYITVHLGTPSSNAKNVRVKFSDYIKNVASSEIYPTWPQSSLEANIYAQISFALNRVFTEWYRSRGFSFDITSSTTVDQYFVEGRNIYQNISVIVDRIFTSFVRRPGRLEPFFTQFCNGTTVTCAGLSQWGTVSLANQGLSPLAILRRYYPRDVEIVVSDNIDNIGESYPGFALYEGSNNQYVAQIQQYLNRIRVNYPLIPQIPSPNGYFDANTKRAVMTFQSIFNLTQDGIIGRATWYKIVQIFVGVTKLAALESEGKWIGISSEVPTVTLKEGSSGSNVLQLQFLLNFIAQFHSSVIPVIQDGQFRSTTTTSVKSFQRTFNLTQDGIVGPATWNKLFSVYRGINNNVEIPTGPLETDPPFPGTLLRIGSSGANVRRMQEYLNVISNVHPSIPRLSVDGIFGPITQSAVREFQRLYSLSVDGIIGPFTWGKIVTERNRILNS